jgi:multicomponent Na+:H+ antiporter subunit E
MQAEPSKAQRSRHLLLVFVLSFGLWLGLTASLDPAELVAGALVAAVVTLLALDRPPVLGGVRLTPGAPVALLRYLAAFLLALVRANLDMARRVLSPSLPIRPAVVRVRTELTSELGRLVLANSITLTPGTLTVDVQGDELLVHWIDCRPGTDTAAITRAIAADFERHLKGFLL